MKEIHSEIVCERANCNLEKTLAILFQYFKSPCVPISISITEKLNLCKRSHTKFLSQLFLSIRNPGREGLSEHINKGKEMSWGVGYHTTQNQGTGQRDQEVGVCAHENT